MALALLAAVASLAWLASRAGDPAPDAELAAESNAAIPLAPTERSDPAAVPAGPAQTPPGVASDWMADVAQFIERDQRQIYQHAGGMLVANSLQDFRGFFGRDGLTVVPPGTEVGGEEAAAWRWTYTLRAAGREGSPMAAVETQEPSREDNRVTYNRGGGITEVWENREEGLEQRFYLAHRPAGAEGEVVLEGEMGGSLTPRGGGEKAILCDGGSEVLEYGKLVVHDAAGRALPAAIEVAGTALRLRIDDRDALYPVTVDPLLTSPSWIADPTDQAGAYFGFSVSTAGDVNGDGYSDVIVGAYNWDGAAAGEGRAYVYHGSAAGLSPAASPDWTADPTDQAWASFAQSVSTAGDVNGDGYSDVIVGAGAWDGVVANEGRAYVYHGSATGLSPGANPDWTGDPTDQTNAYFGGNDWSNLAGGVSTAGDVNGDGYSDVIVGAYYWDGVAFDEGRAYVYHGSPTGLSSGASPDWTADPTDLGWALFGASVSSAGDVNGDGYGDVIIGAYGWDGVAGDEGRAYVYHGSATGLSPAASPDWTADPTDQADARFGSSVSTAGDVNGDGYSDVIVGAYRWDGAAADEGRAYVYHGSATGLSATPDWTADPTDQVNAWFGFSVSAAGDVNGDGYSDVIVGADAWAGVVANEGRAYVYHGSATGLSPAASPDWTVDPTDQVAKFGYSVSTAGDVNGDGYGDLIIGACLWNGVEGRAYVYYGSGAGLAPALSPNWTADPTDQVNAWFGFSVSAAGDVNGDGYSDVIVGAHYWDGVQPNEGRAYVYHGSATGLSPAASPDWTADPTDQSGADFGYSVSTAGDVNGDGYGDVIIGARTWNLVEGRAYVYFGSPVGLSASPGWVAGPPDVDPNADFGGSVSTAGDVNGDGFSDVIVGAGGWDGAALQEGRAYVYHGSASGLSPAGSPDWVADPTDQGNAYFGISVSTAGDVNGDGFSDVIVGAYRYDGAAVREGRAYVYHGSATGVSATANWTADPTDQSDAFFGCSVSTAGDVNGDGYSDVIVGAYPWDGAAADEGRAYVYHGNASGLSPGGSPDWVADPADQSARFGISVSTAGDVNGDGFSDVIVGARYWNFGSEEGRAYVYHGSATGLSLAVSPNWTADPTDQSGAFFGCSVSTAGDVNGDGYSDVIVGAYPWDGAAADEGRAYVYYGNGGPGLSLRPRQARADGSALVQLLGAESGNSFRIRLLARAPAGRTRVKLQWEVKPLGTPFNLTDLGQTTPWIDTGVAGTEIDQLVSGLGPGPHHWRARLVYFPHMAYGHWFSIGPNGGNETDVRTLGAPAIGLSPPSLSFSTAEGGPNPPNQIFTITNTGDAATTLNWIASEALTWLSVTPASGSLAFGSSSTITVSIDNTALAAGTYTGMITITAGGASNSPQTAAVTVQVFPAGLPLIDLSPASLSFTGQVAGAGPADQTFTITNTGSSGTTLNYTISDDAGWLSAWPASGALSSGGSATITASVNLADLSKGTYTGTITVSDAAAANNPQTITVTLTLKAPWITLSPSSLTFGAVEGGSRPAVQSIAVSNTGDAGTTLSFAATWDQSWLSVSPGSGSVGAGASTLLTCSVDAAGLAPGTYNGAITVSDASASNTPQTVAVTVFVFTGRPAFDISPSSFLFSVRPNRALDAQTFEVTNTGERDSYLMYTVATDAAWLTISPSTGSLAHGSSATHTVSANPNLVDTGVHTATITLIDPNASDNPRTIRVSLADVRMGLVDLRVGTPWGVVPGRKFAWDLDIRNFGNEPVVAGLAIQFPPEWLLHGVSLPDGVDVVSQDSHSIQFAFEVDRPNPWPTDPNHVPPRRFRAYLSVPPEAVVFPGQNPTPDDPRLRIGDTLGPPQVSVFASLSLSEWAAVRSAHPGADAATYAMQASLEKTEERIQAFRAMPEDHQYNYLLTLTNDYPYLAHAIANYVLIDETTRYSDTGQTPFSKGAPPPALVGRAGVDWRTTNSVYLMYEGFRDGRHSDAIQGLVDGAGEVFTFGLWPSAGAPAWGHVQEYKIGKTTGYIAGNVEFALALYGAAGLAQKGMGFVRAAGSAMEPIGWGIDWKMPGGLFYQFGADLNVVHIRWHIERGWHLALLPAGAAVQEGGRWVVGAWLHFYPSYAYIYGIGEIPYEYLMPFAHWLWPRGGASPIRGSRLAISWDPNEITSDPAAAYIRQGQAITYRIDFENLASATAEAQDVRVEFPVDSAFDLESIEFLASSHSDILTTAVDAGTRKITWTFTGINLPPNATPPEGEGYVSFQLTPRSDLESGTAISAAAKIYFDFNPAVPTSTLTHTLDSVAPTTRVTSASLAGGSSLSVEWQGSDPGTNASGLREAWIYVFVDGRGYDLGTPAQSSPATVSVASGQTYSVLIVGVDNAGNSEANKSAPDAVVTVSASGSGGGGGGGGCEGTPEPRVPAHAVLGLVALLILALSRASPVAR